jgi:ribosomal protein S27E
MSEQKQFDRFRCPGCSADMDFDPESGQMKCKFCGHTEAVPTEPGAIAAPHSLVEFLAKVDDAHLRPIADEALQVSCDGCGSMVVFQPPEVAGTCPFCGATIVTQPKAADPLIAPDGILPAKVPKKAAQTEVRAWIESRWFAPSALKRLAQQEGIAGVYLPFWDYAADTNSRYRGARGVYYWVTETYEESDGQGGRVQRTRQVQQTSWSPAAGEASHNFDNVLIAATRSVTESRLDALQPWDMNLLCGYEPQYLAGFKAQRYQLELPAGFEKAKSVMAEAINEDVRADIGGNEQRVDGIDTEYTNVTFQHLLLPVWIGAYRFQGKIYQVLVNARTGEVQGERPYSVWKIAMLVAAVLLILWIWAMLSKR